MYTLGFLKNDTTGMQEQLAWAVGKRGAEAEALFWDADTQAFYGRVQKARELSQRAIELAKRNEVPEIAAFYQARTAVREASIGNALQARRAATEALALATGKTVRVIAAHALAAAGDVVQAQKLVDKLDHDFPLDTLIQGYVIPTIRAEIELAHGRAAQAIEALQITSSYELGAFGGMNPVYVRGLAYLHAGNGVAAAAEFQKMLDHRGMLGNSPTAALPHLGLARARALTDDKPSSRSAYQDFLALWKDADPEIPILQQAKAEYAKLQ